MWRSNGWFFRGKSSNSWAIFPTPCLIGGLPMSILGQSCHGTTPWTIGIRRNPWGATSLQPPAGLALLEKWRWAAANSSCTCPWCPWRTYPLSVAASSGPVKGAEGCQGDQSLSSKAIICKEYSHGISWPNLCLIDCNVSKPWILDACSMNQMCKLEMLIVFSGSREQDEGWAPSALTARNHQDPGFCISPLLTPSHDHILCSPCALKRNSWIYHLSAACL